VKGRHAACFPCSKPRTVRMADSWPGPLGSRRGKGERWETGGLPPLGSSALGRSPGSAHLQSSRFLGTPALCPLLATRSQAHVQGLLQQPRDRWG